jgi:sortase B
MQTPGDEEYYLRRNFKKKNAKTGTPFLDKDSDFENPNSRVMIHGHNLKSGGMFYPLMQYTKKSHWKKYPTLSVDTLYQQRTYQIVAVVRVDLAEAGHFAYYAYDNFTSEASYNGFMEDAKKASLYDTGITPVYGQQVLVISTCSYHVSGDGGRLAIIAVQTP